MYRLYLFISLPNNTAYRPISVTPLWSEVHLSEVSVKTAEPAHLVKVLRVRDYGLPGITLPEAQRAWKTTHHEDSESEGVE